MTPKAKSRGQDASHAVGSSGSYPDGMLVPWDPQRLESLVAEANALALYIARHGAAVLGEDNVLDTTSYADLLTAIAAASESPSPSEWQTLLTAYAKVTSVTYAKLGVNGRTILDTANGQLRPAESSQRGWLRRLVPKWLRSVWVRRFRPVWIGVVFFAGALAMEVAMTPALVDPDSFTAKLVVALAPLLFPALWGGIGACTFLMKRLSDKLFELSYEESRQRGEVVRIILGAVIGVVATQVFTEFSSDGSRLHVMTAAFVAGLGVKPVYAAFESLIEGLARRLGPSNHDGRSA